MSTLKVDGIRNNSATSDAITLASDGTCQAKLVRVGGGGLSGFRNLVINGNMKIHQKTNLALSTTLGYRTADRFYVRATSTSTIFHNSCLNGVLKCYGANAVTAFDTRHGIEWDDEFYGKTMTLSFNATTQSGGVKVAVELVDGAITTTAQDYAHVTGTTVNVYNYTLNSTSGWYGNKYVLTVDIPSDADVSFTPDMLRLRIGNSNSGSSQSFELSNVQLEFGDTPTVFEYEPEHITLDKYGKDSGARGRDPLGAHDKKKGGSSSPKYGKPLALAHFDKIKKSMEINKKEVKIISETSEVEKEYKNEVSSLTKDA